MKPIYDSIVEKFLELRKTFVVTDVSRLAESLNILHFFSITSLTRIAKNCSDDRILGRHRIPALKKCPNCAEEVPLSVLMCDACDYNFLSGMVGCRLKLLPSPEPLTHERL